LSPTRSAGVARPAAAAGDVADEVVILNSGRIVVDTSAAELRRSGVDLRQHLGIF